MQAVVGAVMCRTLKGENLMPRFLESRAPWLMLWWGWMPLLYGIFWGVSKLLFGGYAYNQTVDQFMLANVWSGSGFLVGWFAIGALGSAVIVAVLAEDRRERIDAADKSAIAASMVLLLVFSVVTFNISWDNDKDSARYYAAETTFHVPNVEEVPTPLRRLTDGATQNGGDECKLIGAADVPSCITQGTLDKTGWEPRVGSLDGAKFALRRSTGDKQKVSLNEATLAYLNESADQPARWSGVLDGKDLQQSLGGVAEWTGSGNANQCEFEGDYAIDRAFAGTRSNSLTNLLAEKYPALRWDISDVWGYCNGEEPIVVVPTTKQVRDANRTVDTFGGLVTVRGDSGQTKLVYFASAKPGEFPGPVYPASLAAKQRVDTQWAAGRQNRDRNGFGFAPATSDAQAGNVSEYLLRNKATGRLEWVTPLTLRNSSSELFVAYAISPADEASGNELNQLDVYVLGDEDPRRINIDNLEADALNFLVDNAGTFKSNGGRLVEFTPVDGDMWRAFGELNGRVVYQLDISASNKIAPKLVNLSPQSQGEKKADQPDNSACGQPLAGLTQPQLVNCIQQMATALEQSAAAGG
jgi:hypothetical protein